MGKDLEISPTFCILPWIHLSSRPNGDVRLCSTANAKIVGATNKKGATCQKETENTETKTLPTFTSRYQVPFQQVPSSFLRRRASSGTVPLI